MISAPTRSVTVGTSTSAAPTAAFKASALIGVSVRLRRASKRSRIRASMPCGSRRVTTTRGFCPGMEPSEFDWASFAKCGGLSQRSVTGLKAVLGLMALLAALPDAAMDLRLAQGPNNQTGDDRRNVQGAEGGMFEHDRGKDGQHAEERYQSTDDEGFLIVSLHERMMA